MPNALFVGRVPKYRHHKPTGQAVVTLSGKDHYLGPWKSKASRAEYDRLIGEWLAAGRALPKPDAQLTVAELALRYLTFAKWYYRQEGQPTRSLEQVKRSIRALRESYAYTLVGDFGPLALQALQHKLATSGLCRRDVNYLVDTIRRMFKWGVEERIAHWHPNQLRHAAATEIRKHFGLEDVQAVLGHKSMVVSEVYTEKNLALAAEVM